MVHFNEKLFEVMKYYDITNITESDEGREFISRHPDCSGLEVYKAKPKPEYENDIETIVQPSSKLPINLVDILYKYEVLPEIYGNGNYLPKSGK